MIQVCDPPRVRPVRRFSAEEFCFLLQGEAGSLYRPRSEVLRMLTVGEACGVCDAVGAPAGAVLLQPLNADTALAAALRAWAGWRGVEGGQYALRLLLQNTFTDKVNYCHQHGIDIDPQDWPSHHLPTKIMTDRGSEFIGGPLENLCESYHIEVENLPAYRPDLKGVVEKLFDLMPGLVIVQPYLGWCSTSSPCASAIDLNLLL